MSRREITRMNASEDSNSRGIKIERKKKTVRFTIVPNDLLRPEAGLSFDATGLLVELLSHEDGFNAGIKHTMRRWKWTHLRAQRAWSELEQKGYVRREKLRLPNGQIDWLTKVSDEPRYLEDQGPADQGLENQGVDSQTLVHRTLDINTPKKYQEEEPSRSTKKEVLPPEGPGEGKSTTLLPPVGTTKVASGDSFPKKACIHPAHSDRLVVASWLKPETGNVYDVCVECDTKVMSKIPAGWYRE